MSWAAEDIIFFSSNRIQQWNQIRKLLKFYDANKEKSIIFSYNMLWFQQKLIMVFFVGDKISLIEIKTVSTIFLLEWEELEYVFHFYGQVSFFNS